MNFKYFFFILLLLSCDANTSKQLKKSSFTSSGFAYIYNENDYSQKIINKKFDPNLAEVSHLTLKVGTIVKLTNPINNKSHNYKIKKKSRYPEFYKILITPHISKHLQLDSNLPFLEIQEIKRNKSFIAEKAKMFNEEKKIYSSAPVEKVQIDNIGTKIVKNKKIDNFSIIIANFYSIDSAKLLKKSMIKKTININVKKIRIKAINKNNFELYVGPYNSINLLKNAYIELKKFGFEELNVQNYE